MSKQSQESQPSIDEILSSIREIIAHEGTGKSAAEPDAPRASDAAEPRNNGDGHDQTDVLSVLRGGEEPDRAAYGPQQDASEPAEEVLDLSEEFIVTEAQARSQEGGDTQEDAEPREVPADATDDAAIGQAELWADFQMPVGEDGPASPFTAPRHHPESTWPGDDPFDVTESYKLARSRVSSGRFARHTPEQETGQASTADEAETVEQTSQPEAPDGSGLELISLNSTEAIDQDDQEDREAAVDSPANAENSAQPSREAARPFPAADELEAVFGMPPRRWDAPSHTQVAISAPDEQPAWEPEEAHAGYLLHTSEEAPDLSEPQPARDTVETEDAPSASEAPAPAAEGSETEQPGAVRQESPQQASAPDPAAAPDAPSTASEPEEMPSRSQTDKTLEDSVKELLRPMLQQWLDENMPRLVEAAMREQVATSQAQTGYDGARHAQGDDRRDDER